MQFSLHDYMTHIIRLKTYKIFFPATFEDCFGWLASIHLFEYIHRIRKM